MSDPADLAGLGKTRLIIETALALKAEEPLALDMREVSSFADTFVILSGRSNLHVRAVSDTIIGALREAGDDPLGVEGLSEGRWVLIDANDAVVHVFEPETRQRYELERLWSDAPQLDLVDDLGIEPGELEQEHSASR